MQKKICPWAKGMFDEYQRYHDEEWGVPVHDEREHFEYLLLEGAQAGLSWSTIIKKREGYREAFDNFEPEIVALYNDEKFEELVNNPKIIRNKLKIKSAINNAKRFLEVQKEFGTFDKYIWSFTDHKVIHGKHDKMENVPVTTPISDALSKDLKKRGFSFVGSTIMYAHMQAIGMVNDHLTSCYRYSEIKNS